ncbi:aminopeptidase P family protein [uncultured Rhodospira sp.]|uniref:aminopeptidase P family protein n=1 Tax=uncultured Rhodospira sp. TaxID=1936189 RepID=UPI00263029AD|nr:aminopeptidase P family protein [uncultured Rhodospira sp.]
MTPTASQKTAGRRPRTAAAQPGATDQAIDRLVEVLARSGRARPDPDGLRALVAGIAATPRGLDHAWMDLVVVPPRPPEVVEALIAARAALAPPPLDLGGAADGARLKAVRGLLDGLGVSGFVVPRADAHQGEFVAANAERLAWLTGFTGSAGVAVVLQSRAALFVDGRYTLQAAAEVDTSHWEIVSITRTPVSDWLERTLRHGERIGFDAWLHTIAETDRITAACQRVGARFVPVPANPIDTLWTDRPSAPLGPVVPHPETYAGRSSADKRGEIRDHLREKGCAATVITDPAAVAWLLNIRGADVPYSPLALSYAILHDDGRVRLFMDSRKLTPAARAHLGADVTVRAPGGLGPALDALGNGERRVLLSRAGCPQWIRARLTAAGAAVTLGTDPIALPRARKTPAEVDGARAAHQRDGAALCRFLCWLDREGPRATQTEMSAAEHLRALRAEGALYRGPSFETISGAGPNGAIVHYRVTPATDRRIEPDMLYLVDSGAQYRDGTTDVTRTVAIGTPTAEQIRRFTRVLQGHIALATVRFPAETTGTHLDALTRLALWQDGVDFAHGAGHGVGSHLGVHEGPQRISRRPSDVALEPGMILSNEPGYYKTGAFGIRIENLVVVTPIEAPDGAEVPLFGFETLTLAPIDRRLIDPALLTPGERHWLDAYHARVLAEIGPLLDAEAGAWLEAATRPLAPSDGPAGA